jgi:EmrB/QacA subfamily drug resistance transporter
VNAIQAAVRAQSHSAGHGGLGPHGDGAPPAVRGFEPTGARRQAAALALILTASFMVVLDFSIVNVALAAIERELHADATGVQWVITAYAITFGGLLVLGGRMGDLWGRRRMFAVGLVVFSLASLAGGLAPDLAALVAARAFQGVGAAIVAPAALSLVTTTVPEGPARIRALGFYGATASVGFVAGLVLGGILVQFFDWRAVLWVNVPIGLAAALLTPLLVSAPTPMTVRRRLDVTGALLVTGAAALAVYAISQTPASGWTSDQTVGALLVALGLTAAFVIVERRQPAPLVRFSIFRLRPLRTANLFTLLIGAWSAGQVLVTPLYLQMVLHYSPLLTGLAIAPQGIAGFLGASRGARIIRRSGLKAFLVLAGASASAGLLLLALMLATRSYPLVVVALILTGYGTSTGAFAATVAATQGVTNAEQGLAGGLINMSRQIGAAIGVALAAAVIGTATTSGGTIGPDRSALILAATTAVLATVLASRGIAIRSQTVPSDRASSGSSHPAVSRVCTERRGDRPAETRGRILLDSLENAHHRYPPSIPRRPPHRMALAARGYGLPASSRYRDATTHRARSAVIPAAPSNRPETERNRQQ